MEGWDACLLDLTVRDWIGEEQVVTAIVAESSLIQSDPSRRVVTVIVAEASLIQSYPSR